MAAFLLRGAFDLDMGPSRNLEEVLNSEDLGKYRECLIYKSLGIPRPKSSEVRIRIWYAKNSKDSGSAPPL